MNRLRSPCHPILPMPDTPLPTVAPDAATRRWRHAFHACLVAVMVLSLLPTSVPTPTTGWDKSNHLLGFAVLGWLGCRAYAGSTLPVLAGLLVWGGLIEMLQSLTPYRLAEWGDLLADGLGALVGAALAWLVARRRRSAA
jgi:VanZ family protein